VAIHVHWIDAAAPSNNAKQDMADRTIHGFSPFLVGNARKIGRASVYHVYREFLGHTYAAVVAGSASPVGGGFANPPDTAWMQRLRASLSEDT
jgi:hypothetical protein